MDNKTLFSSFNLGDSSTYRTQLMGIATIMIIACHAQASRVIMSGVISKILIQGNYGVDLFLLLSGLGMYYSMTKKPVTSMSDWGGYFKKRLYRLFVPYEIIFLPYCIVLLLLGIYSLSDALWSLIAVEYWLFHRGAWFVSFLIILYLLTPLLYRLLSSKHKWCWMLVLIVVIMAICSIPVGTPSNSNVVHNIQFAFGHTPCFLLGMAAGGDCKNQRRISPLWLLMLAAAGIVCLKLSIVGAAVLVIPLLVYLFVCLIKLTMRMKWINGVLLFFGTISLESYLTNITLNGILVKIIPDRISSPIFYGRYLEYFIVVVLGIALAFIVNELTNDNKPIKYLIQTEKEHK